jgi:hypothetical protein
MVMNFSSIFITFPPTSNAFVFGHGIVNQAATDVVLGFVRLFRWHPPKNDPHSFIGFTGWTGFLHGLAQRNDVGGLIIGSILEVLHHLRLVGVFDLEPFTLRVISGGGIKVHLENSGGVDAVGTVFGDVDTATIAESYEDLVLIGRVVVRDQWS